MRHITTLVAIFLAALIVPTSIYAIQNPSQGINTNKPEDIALRFIRDGPTFSFDGITTTLKITSMTINKSYPPQYVVTVDFQCLHGGYGDRTGEIVLQAITSHTAIVTVIEEKGVSGVVDGIWDEVAQRTVADETKSAIEAIALNWLVNAPTFKFDGVAGSAKVVNSFQAMTFAAPSFWGVTIEFDCQYAGYGDRSGLFLAAVVTHHVATIHVVDGKVTMAYIDDKWNELTQASLASAILTPEDARDIAVNYVTQKFNILGTAPSKWIMVDLTSKELLGSQTTQYMSEGWIITVQHAVVWKPTYNVTVLKDAVSWMGSVDQNGNVIETVGPGPSVPELIYTPDIARKLCIDYIIVNHPEIGAQMPIEWTEKILVPDGIVGITKILYTSDGWNVTVSAPVVWKPTHTVSITFSGPSESWKWEGTVPQGGHVQEISFSK